MRRVTVLGAGLVGSVIAEDMVRCGGYRVTVADRDERRLEQVRRRTGNKAELRQVDVLEDRALRELVGGQDIAIGALSSRIGFRVLSQVIEAGTNYCDISFMPEDARKLDERAVQKNVTAVVDCGVAPGLSHMMAGYAAAQLDATRSLKIYVGGLPQQRFWPFDYKAGFAPQDVIEEYLRPCRVIENGRVVQKDALSEPELIDFPGVGTLEAFNTDGLRSLVDTLVIPDMKEKTLRYPGHLELMRTFRETGFFSEEPINAGGVEVRPLDVFSALVFPRWKYEEGEADLTAMRVEVRGTRGGEPASMVWDLLDRYDAQRAVTSMARTTAFPCAAIARLIDEGRVEEKGVLTPELLGKHAPIFRHVLDELRERGVRCREESSFSAD